MTPKGIAVCGATELFMKDRRDTHAVKNCSLQKEDSVHWIMKGSNINFFDFSSSSSATQMKSGPAIIPSHEILMSRFPVFLVSLLV